MSPYGWGSFGPAAPWRFSIPISRGRRLRSASIALHPHVIVAGDLADALSSSDPYRKTARHNCCQAKVPPHTPPPPPPPPPPPKAGEGGGGVGKGRGGGNRRPV